MQWGFNGYIFLSENREVKSVSAQLQSNQIHIKKVLSQLTFMHWLYITFVKLVSCHALFNYCAVWNIMNLNHLWNSWIFSCVQKLIFLRLFPKEICSALIQFTSLAIKPRNSLMMVLSSSRPSQCCSMLWTTGRRQATEPLFWSLNTVRAAFKIWRDWTNWLALSHSWMYISWFFSSRTLTVSISSCSAMTYVERIYKRIISEHHANVLPLREISF